MSWRSFGWFPGAESFVREGEILHKVVVDSERPVHS